MLGFKKRFSILVALSAIGYVLSFGNQLVISYYFGTSINLDAYWAALAIANFLCFYLHPFKEALVPATYRSGKISVEAASDMLSAGATLLIALVILSTAIILIYPKFLINWFGGGNASAQQLVTILPWFAPFLLLFTFAETLSSILIGFNKNIMQATARVFAGVTSLLVLITFSADFGIKAMIFSLTSYQAAIIIIAVWSLKKLNLKLKLNLNAIEILQKQKVFTLFGALFLSYLLAQFYILIQRNVMMQMSSGLLSSFQYSTSLVNVLLSILAFPFSNLLWNKFLEANHNKVENVDRILFKSIAALITILLPICCFAYLHAEVIIFIVFSRGEFDYQSLLTTTEAFKATIFTAVPIGITAVTGRYLISSHHPKLSSYIAIATSLVGVVIIEIAKSQGNIILVQWHWFLANTAGLFISLLLILSVLNIKHGNYFSAIKFIALCLVSIAVAVFCTPALDSVSQKKLTALVFLFAEFICFSLVFGVLIKITGASKIFIKEASKYET